MSRMIQVRNVPDRVHRTLKVRAAQEGVSLSDFILVELKRLADRPTMKELLERIARLEPVTLTESAASAVRAEREAR